MIILTVSVSGGLMTLGKIRNIRFKISRLHTGIPHSTNFTVWLRLD